MKTRIDYPNLVDEVGKLPNTHVRLDGYYAVVKFYDTDVFRVHLDGTLIHINTGGYRTNVTFNRINLALHACGWHDSWASRLKGGNILKFYEKDGYRSIRFNDGDEITVDHLPVRTKKLKDTTCIN